MTVVRNRRCGTSPGSGLAHLAEQAADATRAADLVEQYSDLPLGTADAIVIAIAERLRAVNVATLDRRHFSVVRPAHTTSFALLP